MDLEAVQPAQLFGDPAKLAAREGFEIGLVYVLEVDLVKRIAEEDLGYEQPSVLAEGQRVRAGHAVGDLNGLVATPDIDLAQQKGGPGHGAIVGEGDVVGHAGRRIDDPIDLARIDLHAIERLAN